MPNPVFDDAIKIGEAFAGAFATGTGKATLDPMEVSIGGKTLVVTPSLDVTVK